MLTKDKFVQIMNKNRQECEDVNAEEITCTNGTSPEVLEFLKTLGNPETMTKTVKELETEMFKTFNEVHKIEGSVGY